MMAILRDVSICYDGTLRNICANSIIQFQYNIDKDIDLQPLQSGDLVGALAVTVVIDSAYKAVLHPYWSTDSSWELMRELLLLRSNFTNDENSRRVILYLQEESGNSPTKFWKEKLLALFKVS